MNYFHVIMIFLDTFGKFVSITKTKELLFQNQFSLRYSHLHQSLLAQKAPFNALRVN